MGEFKPVGAVLVGLAAVGAVDNELVEAWPGLADDGGHVHAGLYC